MGADEGLDGGDDSFVVSGMHGTISEQRSEEHFDWRDGADDDLEKGRIRFPRDKLYGRESELAELGSIYRRVAAAVVPLLPEGAAAADDPAADADNNEGAAVNEPERRRSSAAAPTRGGSLRRRSSAHFVRSAPAQIVFLAGLSGTGKSTLVDELVRRVVEGEGPDRPSKHPLFGSGKFVQRGESAPFAAVSEVLAAWSADLLANRDAEELRRVRSNLKKSCISGADEGGRVLISMFPVLSSLLSDDNAERNEQNVRLSAKMSKRTSIDALRVLFQSFVIALTRKLERPLVMFIDDLQWADEASMDLIASLLKSKVLEHCLFIGAYRSNEVGEEHPFRKRMSAIKECVGGEDVHQMEIFNLSPKDIGQFVADTIDKDESEVAPLTDLVFKKTLGNIFFAMQALEELVRRNVLYFDVICYEWQWNLDMATELESFVNYEVIDMIKVKIGALEASHQRALTLASATCRNAFDVETLRALLAADGFALRADQVVSLLDEMVEEGLLLKGGSPEEYTFAHDLIREAANDSVPAGEERDRLLVQVAKTLAERSSSTGEEWSLFVAVNHFNSVPRQYLDSSQDLAELNLQAARLASAKAALSQAVEFLRAGVASLPSAGRAQWQKYQLCLDLFTRLVQAEATLGNYDNAEAAIDVILQNATCDGDKSVARVTLVKISAEKNGRDYSEGAKKGAEILKLPFHPKQSDILLERVRLKMVRRGRRLKDLVNMPTMEDSSKMPLCAETQRYANMSQNYSLSAMIHFTALRKAYSLGISSEFAEILANSAVRLVKEGYFRRAFAYANLAVQVKKQVSDAQKGAEHSMFQIKLIQTALPLRIPYREDIAAFDDYYKSVIAGGLVEWGMGCAMTYAFSYYAAGIPLSSLFGSKLVQYERASRELGQESFGLILRASRQFFLNLRGNSTTGVTDLNGEAFDEDDELAELEGNSRNMALRDISMFRIQLAYIFCDDSTMEEMIARLESYPIFDLLVARQHLRISFLGLALFSLRTGDKKMHHLKLGGKIMKYMKRLWRAGSPNAHPVYRCLKAAKQPSRASYDKAITACSDARMMHLEAMMNERCALYLQSQNENEVAKEYFENALFHYSAWGAYSKVIQLRAKHIFLKGVSGCRDHTSKSEVSSLY